MRFAIFSDIHANRQAWEAVMADARRQRAETLICLGDVVGYGPKPQEVLMSVRAATANFVLGNHDAAACGRLDPAIFNVRAREVIEWTRDRLDADAQEFLQQVPMQIDGPGLLFVHAEVVEPGEFGYIDGVGPAGPNLRAMKVPLAFIGHTHLPMAFTMPKKGGQVTQKPPVDFKIERGKRYIVNVGSVGEPRTTDVRASYVIYDDATKTISFRKVEFDVDGYLRDLEETGLDIKPYFVRVVEAGRHAKPPPTAAPQLALTHLPKIAESVAGHHGSVVVGQPGAAGRTLAGPIAGRRPPGTVTRPSPAKPALAVMLVLLVLIGGVVVMWVTSSDPDPPVAAGAESGDAPKVLRVVKPRPRSRPAEAARPPLVADREAPVKRVVPIKFLGVKIFREELADLESLRDAEAQGTAAETKNLSDGLLGLDVAGQREHFGLIWEGFLVVPETREYSFTLDASFGSALFVDGTKIAEVSGSGGEQSGSRMLEKGSATPFRLEYLHGAGEPRLDLTWSGKDRQEGASLMRPAVPGELAATPVAMKEATGAAPPEPPVEPKPPEPPKRPANLSKGLVGYWSLDFRNDGAERFTKRDDGKVEERLVSAGASKVRVFVPDAAFPEGWTQIGHDASGWRGGWNGVGYETAGDQLASYIHTEVGKTPGQHPFSVLVRIPFTVDDPKSYTKLVLQTRFTGGFVAYINGQLVAAEHAPSPSTLRWNSRALAARR
ncbi:MAG: hypothetical protein HKN82_10690, partial [Akkermansiaceae bacterium]|nr:hypothetical protein [Akkermansiaceae bacterium]